MIASTSSSWPFPATPGDAQDLARRDVEVDAVDGLLAAIVAGDQALDLEGPRADGRDATVGDQRHLAADHQLREVLLVRLGRDPLADDADRAG